MTTTTYSYLISKYAKILDVLEIDVESYIEFADDTVTFSMNNAEVSVLIPPDELRYANGCYKLELVAAEQEAVIENIDGVVCVNYCPIDADIYDFQDNLELLAFVAFICKIATKLYIQDTLPKATVYVKDGTLGVFFDEYMLEVSLRNDDTKLKANYEAEVEFFEVDGVIVFNL